MQFLSKAFAAVVVAAVVSANPTEFKERQLPTLPIPVCATGDFLGGLPLLDSIVEFLGSDLLACSTGEICTALALPLVGSLLPLGICE